MRSGWAIGIPVVFLHSLVDFPMQIPAIAGLLFIMLGALWTGEKMRNRTTDAKGS